MFWWPNVFILSKIHIVYKLLLILYTEVNHVEFLKSCMLTVCVSYFYIPYPREIQVAREKHFFPKGAFPAESIPPLVRPPHATRQRRRSAEAHAQLASGALRFSHGGGQSGCLQQGSGKVWSGADFGGVEAAAEPGRWEDGIRRRAAPGAFGQGLSSVILPLRKPRFKEGWEPLNIYTSRSISSCYLGPGTVLNTVGTCFHPSSLQLCEDCNHSLRESPRAASERS